MKLAKTLQDYMATVKTDFSASMDYLANDVVWINLLPDNVPFSGEYHGHQGIMNYFRLLAETFQLGDYHWDEFDYTEAGNTLVMVGTEKNGKVLPTGKVFDLPFVWIVKFNDEGKICYLREHNDTAAIGDAFKRSEN